MKQLTVYTFAELKEQFPEAYERVIERMRQSRIRWGDAPWVDEICDSSRAASKCFVYNRHSHVEGARALAWFEQCIEEYRIPWSPMSKSKTRRTYAKYGAGYKPGCIRPCPWTGYCADDAFIAGIKRFLAEGGSTEDIPRELKHMTDVFIEEEREGYVSEESIVECLENEDHHYTEAGIEV